MGVRLTVLRFGIGVQDSAMGFSIGIRHWGFGIRLTCYSHTLDRFEGSADLGLRVYGFRVQALRLRFRVHGIRFRVLFYGLGLRV